MTLLYLLLRDIRLLTIITALFLLLFTLMQTFPVHAAVFNPGCTAGVGNTAALVTAVATANSNTQADTINLVAGCTYTLTSALMITADGGNALTVQGNGATISGNDSVQPIRLFGVNTTVVLYDLTIRDGLGVSGGGIETTGGSQTLTLHRVTVRDNVASGSGGGIYVGTGTTLVTLNNSTVTGNSAGAGGGILANAAPVTLNNSTVSGNAATASIGGNGGGLQAGTFELYNTIVANNTATGTGDDCHGAISGFNSLVEATDGMCAIVDGVDGNIRGVDPALGGLTGNPAYFPIGSNSPAINAGDNLLIPVGMTTDQRGAGFPRIEGTTVDMGSYEHKCVAFPVTIGSSATDDLLFAVDCANASPANDVINLRPSTYALQGEPIYINGNMTINGNAATIDAVRLSRVIHQSGGSSVIRSVTLMGGRINIDGGAGVYVTGGSMTLRDTTITDNVATSVAGGGMLITGGGAVNVINSTITGNATDVLGGGIGAVVGSSTLNIYNSTIAGNSAVFLGGGVAGTINELHNSILANNTPGDCMQVTNASFSLSEIACSGVVNNVNNNRTGVDPLLAPLTGSPAYFRLLPGSVAINNGSNALIPAGVTQDQAGNVRTQNTTVDMGSFETTGASLSVTLTLQSRPPAPNNAYITTVHIQLRLPGSPTAFYSTDYLSNASGVFLIQEMTTGTFDVWIKGSHTLAVLHNVTLTAGGNPLTTALLREGDASDNNQIVLQDFSLLAAAFGTAVGNPAYNAQADFNNDGQVTLPDFSLLASNFNQAGVP